MIVIANYINDNATLYYEDNEDLLAEHRDSGVSKVAIKVANFDWSVIMIITTLFLCILYVCGFALLCLKAISSLGDNNSSDRENLTNNAIIETDFSVNFGNIHNQMGSSGHNGRQSSIDTVDVEWHEQYNLISPYLV